MIAVWVIVAALIALASKEITWRHFGDIVVFLVVSSIGVTLLFAVVAGRSTIEKLVGLIVFLGLIYATA
jgi:hypothetical protein